MAHYLSYLMGAEDIQDQELENLKIEIVEKTATESRKLKIPQRALTQYAELIKAKLTPGFWNEIVGEEEIVFVFKFKDGTINKFASGEVKEYKLSPETESEIDKLCAEFNNEPPDKTANVYKYLSENEFYHDFMLEHYSDQINRLKT